MTDDSELERLREELRGIQFYRIEPGRYVVVLDEFVDGRRFTTEIPCRNPAFGHKRRSEMLARRREDGRRG